MKRRYSKGFTVIEMMVVIAVASVFFVMAHSAITGVVQLVVMESSVLDMDRGANQALQEVADALRPAVLPIYIEGDEVSLNTFGKEVLASASQGFNTTYGRQWRDALQAGTDIIAFTVPVDYGGDDDTLDADLYLELGAVLPSGAEEFGAIYDVRKDNKNYLNGAPVNKYLRELNPRGDLDISDKLADLAKGSLPARFAADFTFPAKADQGYAIARFVPHYTNGVPMTISEADLFPDGPRPARSYDLNGDGDTADSFLVGSMEFVYSNTRYPISGPDVLLQMNQTDPNYVPIFKLIRFQAGDASTNSADGFDPTVAEGEFGLLIRLLMLDRIGQDDAIFQQGKATAIVRLFETTVKLRNMMVSGRGE